VPTLVAYDPLKKLQRNKSSKSQTSLLWRGRGKDWGGRDEGQKMGMHEK